MRIRLKPWMLPLAMVVAFTFTTCVVAAFAFQKPTNAELFARTQCMFATVVQSYEFIDSRYVMKFQLMVYRNQEAGLDWGFPDAFICMRR